MGGTAGAWAGASARGRLGRIAVAGIVAAGVWGTVSRASAEAPIKSPQDAACRNEARAKVFVTPDPHGIGLYAIGKQIYMACMARPQQRVARKRRR